MFCVKCNYYKQQKKDKRQVNECNLEREYRDCIKSRRDKIRITRHIMMHQVLYIVNFTVPLHVLQPAPVLIHVHLHSWLGLMNQKS